MALGVRSQDAWELRSARDGGQAGTPCRGQRMRLQPQSPGLGPHRLGRQVGRSRPEACVLGLGLPGYLAISTKTYTSHL